MDQPHFRYETLAMRGGARHVAGVDEVGRGPLCGPVTAAAVILNPGAIPSGLNDSKRLTAARRQTLAEQIRKTSIWSVVHVGVADIDRLNIYHAAHLAMCRAVSALTRVPCLALVDGNALPRALPCAGLAVVKGDAISQSIAAASILAKVARDELMVDLAQQHPGYGWERNAGYGTADHLAALLHLGVTPHHRRSFRPVHNILYQDEIANP
ncbi:ribonuclease HII [Paracoccus pacificus]|uniref:Ribonuclease HII n=1 Tax=Paracoccus pacificus TaxID=1463598 RepID=A0ABW4R221_9RHOB